jgi:hypothetical protein
MPLNNPRRSSSRALNPISRKLPGNVDLFPILFARQEQATLPRGRIWAPRPVSAFVELVSANAFQRRDLLPELRVLFLQS